MADRPLWQAFLLSFREHLFAAMSGGASVPFVIAAVYVDNKYGQAILALLALTCAAFAAYRVWKPERQRVRELEARLSQKIDVYLDPDCTDGVRVVETRLTNVVPPANNRGPDSKWVQIMVKSATDAALVNCEARVIRAERINKDGTATPILTEPLFCTWSNSSAEENRRMTIPPSIPLAANIFSTREGFAELYMEHTPIKFEFRDAIQKPGTYRLKIGVSAQNCPTNVQTFLLKWSASHYNISITKE